VFSDRRRIDLLIFPCFYEEQFEKLHVNSFQNRVVLSKLLLNLKIFVGASEQIESHQQEKQ
jgi:hypothetical protein